jgi:hypothetical protein
VEFGGGKKNLSFWIDFLLRSLATLPARLRISASLGKVSRLGHSPVRLLMSFREIFGPGFTEIFKGWWMSHLCQKTIPGIPFGVPVHWDKMVWKLFHGSVDLGWCLPHHIRFLIFVWKPLITECSLLRGIGESHVPAPGLSPSNSRRVASSEEDFPLT